MRWILLVALTSLALMGQTPETPTPPNQERLTQVQPGTLYVQSSEVAVLRAQKTYLEKSLSETKTHFYTLGSVMLASVIGVIIAFWFFDYRHLVTQTEEKLDRMKNMIETYPTKLDVLKEVEQGVNKLKRHDLAAVSKKADGLLGMVSTLDSHFDMLIKALTGDTQKEDLEAIEAMRHDRQKKWYQRVAEYWTSRVGNSPTNRKPEEGEGRGA